MSDCSINSAKRFVSRTTASVPKSPKSIGATSYSSFTINNIPWGWASLCCDGPRGVTWPLLLRTRALSALVYSDAEVLGTMNLS